jgi:hypothetical protein
MTERLAAEQPEAYEYMLLGNLSNLARIYTATARYGEA